MAREGDGERTGPVSERLDSGAILLGLEDLGWTNVSLPLMRRVV